MRARLAATLRRLAARLAPEDRGADRAATRRAVVLAVAHDLACLLVGAAVAVGALCYLSRLAG